MQMAYQSINLKTVMQMGLNEGDDASSERQQFY